MDSMSDLSNFKPRTDDDCVNYDLCFWFVGHDGWGYSFSCDKDGKPHPFDNPDAALNYELCLAGNVRGHRVEAGIIRSHEFVDTTFASGTCVCGEEVVLTRFTNPCSCGRDYNGSGTLLASREVWGEETNEHPSDIMRIP